MSAVVFSPMGRRIVPGRCVVCGYSDDWECDGRGTIFCSCQCCPQCGEHDGHTGGCELIEGDDEDCESDADGRL